MNSKKSKGWYLGLPYMRGGVLEASRPEAIPMEARPCNAIFADDVFLTSPNWRALLEDWMMALRPGGHIILWLSDCRRCSVPDGLARITAEDFFAIEKQNKKFFIKQLYGNIGDKLFVVISNEHGGVRHSFFSAEKSVLVSRFGTFGDALMSASVLPALKTKGYHVAFMTNERGEEMLRADPHIDQLIVLPQTPPDAERATLFEAWQPFFDKFINLTHTVEGAFLKRPYDGAFFWSDDQRRALCGGSYLGFTHKAAQVEGPYNVRFYPTEEERVWAVTVRNELGPFALWSLAGGACHKSYPHASKAICQLLSRTNLKFVLCGDAGAQEIANQITQDAIDFCGSSERLRSLVQTKSLRHAMALAQLADIVVGPETSVLNAVCMEPMPKIVFLSHSAPSNLTDDWVNTTALLPTAACYPCHRLHADFEFCKRDAKTGAAACAASIPVQSVVTSFLSAVSTGKHP